MSQEAIDLVDPKPSTEHALQLKGLFGQLVIDPAGPGEDIAPAEVTAIGRALPWHGSFDTKAAGAGFVSVTGPTDHSPTPAPTTTAAVDGTTVALVGQPIWTDPELGDFARSHGHAETVAHAFKRYSDAFLRRIAGHFTLAVHDTSAHQGLVAVDRFAQHTLYWRSVGNRLHFASSADALSASTGERSLSDQGLFHYLFFHMVPSPGTIYRDIQKLPAAHAVFIRNHQASVQCYWVPEFREDEPSIEESRERLQGLITDAVGRLDGPATGAFLSGGLDSSTVAGALSRTRGASADTFSIGFDAEGYDEIEFARIANGHFGNTAHEYYVTPDDVHGALPLIAESYDEPFGNSSALPALFCARFAKEHGMGTLLAGDGGDEVFAGNDRYAKQRVFEHYAALPGWLRHGILDPVIGNLPNALPLATKAKSYINQANTPLPDRLQSYNFFVRHSNDEILEPDFLGHIDAQTPFELLRGTYQRPADTSALNRMLYLDWQYTLADNDLRKVNRMCTLGGIDVEYPFLDPGVVDYSTTIASARKLDGDRLRAFYKDAMVGFLPDAILNKSKHGFGLPFGVWMRTNPGLQALSQDCLSQMRRRRLIRNDFMDELTRLHADVHAGYYGEMVWILMMLELWLTSHGFDA
jgi:asparagine synthase (glutamine-hydrolysing)